MTIVLIIPGAFESLRLVQHSMGNIEMCGHQHFCGKWGDRSTVVRIDPSIFCVGPVVVNDCLHAYWYTLVEIF